MKKVLRKIKYILNPDYRFLMDSKAGKYDQLSDEEFIRKKYWASMKRKPDLENPKTFNEKLQWLKLHDRNPKYISMVDKYAAKEYVKETIGGQYIIPTLGVWERFDDIDFDALPDSFVLKCTHDSGGIVLCRDKRVFDKETARKKLENSLKTNFYYRTREWPYKNVPPRIIAEKYMTNNGEDLEDYKIHCFNGEPKLILVCRDRYKRTGLTEDFYSETWEHLDVKRPRHTNAKTPIERPAKLEEMLELSRILAKDLTFARVDFYTVNHSIYFGELTLYPAGGFSAFVPEEYDRIFGDWIELPDGKSNS